jgi:P-type conjugative transfer protein TrbG
MPAVSGSGAQRTTHLIIKPTDAGLISNVIIYTDTRVYSIKLVSTQTQWTPLTAFSYPEAPAQAWEKYGASTTETLASSAVSPAGDVDMDYRISGDAPWRPEHVYSIGGKTIVIFPSAIQYGTAPALIGLANDGSWLSSASEQMLRYRVADNRITIDGLPEHFKLVTGVGSSQTRVDVRRGK